MANNLSLLVPIWVAVVGFITTTSVAIYQGQTESANILRQEERRLQSELIVLAVSAEGEQVRVENLKFLLESGLIDDYQEEIQSLVAAADEPDSSLSASFPSPGVSVNRLGEVFEPLRTLPPTENQLECTN